jgi:hypothetical protein
MGPVNGFKIPSHKREFNTYAFMDKHVMNQKIGDSIKGYSKACSKTKLQIVYETGDNQRGARHGIDDKKQVVKFKK